MTLVCVYCGCENHRVPDVSGMVKAAEEAREIAKWVQQREPVLQEEFAALRLRIQQGETDLVPRALELQEGILRLTFAPTLHMYAAMDPADPRIVEAREEIAGVVREVLTNWRKVLEA